MKQCCMLREDTGKRCEAHVPDDDELCADCCDLLEEACQKEWERVYVTRHDNN
jgi:hypothetical protein